MAESTSSSWLRDFKTLYHLALSRVRGGSHEERLESFYAPQAENYDSFRSKLLHGRREMIETVEFPAGGTWVDLGAGTGSNADLLGERINTLGQAYLVDLCPALLEVSRKRIAERGWNNVQAVEADATTFQPETPGVDVVTCSYSLTMIPNWFAAVENAWNLLKPGGVLGIVDFYVARKFPEETLKRHGWLTRNFWPFWFANDNVFLSPDHLPYVRSRFETVHLTENRGGVPFLPFVSVPHYIFIGRKPMIETAPLDD